MFFLDGRAIDYVDRYDYLGHVICADLSDDADIGEQLSRLSTVGNVLIRKFKFCYDKVKCELFRSFCSSFYCSALWCKFKRTTINKIKVCHNNILRRLLAIPLPYSASHMFVHFNQRNFDALLRNSIFSLKSRLFSGDNDLILAMTSWSRYTRNPLHCHWTRCLFTN